MISKPETVIFYGRSGCGKGTQADLLIKYLVKNDEARKVIYIETGKLLRIFAEKSYYSSKLVKKVLETGGLLPEFLPIFVWSGFLVENVAGNEHLIFDGVCRRPPEAPVLDSAFRFYKREKPKIIVIDVSREWSMNRLLARGRNDDTSEDIKNRLDWYENDVVPTINYFESNPSYKVIHVNGERAIEEVHRDILDNMALTG